ncbi:MAG: hypothetical protein QW470_04850 [Candidatus Caldarchaeum sp.]
MSESRGLFLVKASLVLSLLVGLVILLFDGLLWFDNPQTGHATALIIFSGIQIFLLELLITRLRAGLRVLLYWSALYLIFLLLNPLTGPSMGIPVELFAMYLFGVSPVSSSPQFSCPFLCPPFIITYDLLIVLQIIILAALLNMRRKKQLT